MKRNIIVAKNAFSPDYCNHVLKVATEYREGKVNGYFGKEGIDDGLKDAKARRSKVAWIDNNIDSCDIFQPIYKLTRDVNNKFFQYKFQNMILKIKVFILLTLMVYMTIQIWIWLENFLCLFN